MSNVSKLHGLVSQDFDMKVDESTDAAGVCALCICEHPHMKLKSKIQDDSKYCRGFRGL
jgi:hypothetical protein